MPEDIENKSVTKKKSANKNPIILEKIEKIYLKGKSKKRKISQKKINKNKISQSIFFLMALNTIYIIALSCMVLLRDNIISRESYVIYLFLSTLFLVVVGIFILPYKIKHYGLNFNQWRFNIIFGLLLGGLGSVLAIIIRYYMISIGKYEFEFRFPPEISLLYYPISVFSQETMTRGFLQNYFISIFDKSKSNELIAILLSSLIFSALHLIYGFDIMILSFLFSILLGFFYKKTKSVLGVCITHFMIGASFFYFKGEVI